MNKKIFIILIPIILGMIGWGVWATSNPHSWTNGLVAYWSFDGQYTTTSSGVGAGTKDVSGNSNWGTFSGGVTPVPGIVGQSLSFNGVDGYVQASTTNLNISGDMTIETWVKFNSVTQTNQSIVAKNKSSNTGYWLFYNQVPNATLKIGFFGVNNTTAASTFTPIANEWVHVVVERIGTSVTFYINGVFDVTRVIGGSVNPISYNPLRLGQGSDRTTWPFSGSLDEVRVYNRALSADEVKQHYDKTKRNFTVNQPSGTPPVGWWKMDEPTGQTVRDYSVNANNGTVSSGGYGATSTDGKIGKALDFDGVDDFITIPTYTVDVNNGTIELWVKTSADFTANYGSRGALLGINSIYVSLLALGGSGPYNIQGETDTNSQYYVLTGNIVPVGVWNHIAVSFSNGSTTTTYLNGNIVQVDTTLTGAPTLTLTRIGGGATTGTPGTSNTFNGLIDDVRIYNYARTADQIAGDYQAGAYRTYIGTSDPNQRTNGLVGYWSFDGQYTTSTEGTRDVSGNNKWGTFNGGIKPVGGISGQALSFDGVNDYVDVGAVTPLGKTTITLWFKSTRVATDNGLLSFGSGAIRRLFALPYSTTGNALLYMESSNYRYFTGITPYLDGNWHFLVLYIHGSAAADILQSSLTIDNRAMSVGTTIQSDTPTSWSNFYIGKTGYSAFSGSIDEVRIYNRALSADEIMQQYQQTRRNLNM